MILAPPEGISEGDYDAIEAAVMETVRGRWFLAEFARRSRVDEMRQVLDAIGRLEQVVVDQRTLPPADPSVRLLVQRLKDVSKQLDALALDLRSQGHDEALCAKIETQARAVAGLLRASASPEVHAEAPQQNRLPPATPLVIPERRSSAPEPAQEPAPMSREKRLEALARLDNLSAAEKLALFG
ncbi:MAG TPA: hypothetical protein VGG12_04450 [Methylovirgula sp.]